MGQIKILLLTFKSLFGSGQLFISENYAYHEIVIDSIFDGTLVDFQNEAVYQISALGKHLLKSDEIGKRNDLIPQVQINESDKIDTVHFLEYKCLKRTGSFGNKKYTAQFVRLIADIPQICDYLPDLKYRMMLPIVAKNSKEPYLYQIFLSEKGHKQDGTSADEHILNQLTDVQHIIVPRDFFKKKLDLPDVARQ